MKYIYQQILEKYIVVCIIYLPMDQHNILKDKVVRMCMLRFHPITTNLLGKLAHKFGFCYRQNIDNLYIDKRTYKYLYLNT